ncbi:hypothetical protein QE450_003886 [Paenibacillus sp. SORGH_AS306]|uniref:hypothetical protein n=1 Tax=unclassified Paenibacillus TaxID=185978 RepID=UPI002788FADB|nr:MULTISPECIES: hypothetical protein [unclassified Paenibacillus]MDQ1236388.1 hypothetical protein [Paenibacillus sp. SORGH_AS_0306]MDR6108741.1 hypothetical protein [Paenibacillus sp. SORGH_AS_0338]
MRESLLKNVENIISFDIENFNNSYELKDINFKVCKKFINFLANLSKLENKNEIWITMRGFSLRDNNNRFSSQEHCEFKNSLLNNFFVVGQKAAFYLQEIGDEVKGINTYSVKDEQKLKEDIKMLFDESITILSDIKPEYVQNFKSKFKKYENENSLDKLHYNKNFLIAFLHNIGGRWSGKPYSPMISVTYGDNKKETAKKFATKNSRSGPENDGFIILSYTIQDNRVYEKLTKDLNEELNKLGLEWYQDTHNEIITMDGIMPHKIIGLFEISKNENKEIFIMNPWLQKMFIEDRKFDYKKGININQEYFETYARELGYTSYVSQSKEKRYIINFDEDYKNINLGF